MKEPLEHIFDRYIDNALMDAAQGKKSCLSCFHFVVKGKKVRCTKTKWSGRELRDLLERREYTYLTRRAKNCGKWEGE